MKTRHKVIIGDSRCMAALPDDSVHLIVTSPPYWQLKDYGSAEQIGFDHSYEDYINNLNLVWQECQRVLQPGCRLCINIGDQFARAAYYGRYKIIPIRTEIIKFCECIGFDYMGAIIWQKLTTCNTSGGASIMGSFPFPRNGMIKLDYEFILLFKKQGKSPAISPEYKELSKLTLAEWNQYFAGHWTFPGEKQQAHLAMFPEELPRRLIKMFSFVSETVLDPFLGSGTTTLAAKKCDRNSIGFEINKNFIPIIKEKRGVNQTSLFEENNIEFTEQENRECNYHAEIQKLPYIFKDPVPFDKKIDPKSRNFGSKIDKNHSEPVEYFLVKNILAPNLIVLSNDELIYLLGIQIKDETREAALNFLNEKVKGYRIIIKMDSTIQENSNHRSAYIYLKNKTFINAHLIKKGLALVDLSREYKYRSRFSLYSETA